MLASQPFTNIALPISVSTNLFQPSRPRTRRARWHQALLAMAAAFPLAAADLRVPAFAAYTLPNPEAACISPRSGVTRWTDPTVSVNWYGLFRNTGAVTARVALRLPADAESKLRLTVASASREVAIRGASDGSQVPAEFGTFQILRAGYHRFALEP